MATGRSGSGFADSSSTPSESSADTTSAIESTGDAQTAATDEQKASEAEAQTAAAESASSGPFVVYTGPQVAVAMGRERERRREQGLAPLPSHPGEGTLAEVSVQQWAQVGIASERSHVWQLQNGYRIPVDQFSKEQISYLLTNSKRFALVDAEGNTVKPNA